MFDKFLDPLLSDHIDISCCFIKNHDFSLSQDSSADADELLLSRWKIWTTIRNLLIQTKRVFLEETVELGSLKDLDNPLVWVEAFRIKIETESSREHGWVLRNHSDKRPQIIEMYGAYLNVVDHDGSFNDIDYPAQWEANSAFTSSSPSNYPNLLTWLYFKRQLIEYNFSVWSISENHIVELNIAMVRPCWIACFENFKR